HQLDALEHELLYDSDHHQHDRDDGELEQLVLDHHHEDDHVEHEHVDHEHLDHDHVDQHVLLEYHLDVDQHLLDEPDQLLLDRLDVDALHRVEHDQHVRDDEPLDLVDRQQLDERPDDLEHVDHHRDDVEHLDHRGHHDLVDGAAHDRAAVDHHDVEQHQHLDPARGGRDRLSGDPEPELSRERLT